MGASLCQSPASTADMGLVENPEGMECTSREDWSLAVLPFMQLLSTMRQEIK